jgi:hypothetical protein
MVAERQSVFASRGYWYGVAQAAVWGFLVLAAIKAGREFGHIFRDFGTKLPELTEVVLMVSNWLAHYWYLALLALLLWPFVNWGIVNLLSQSPRAAALKWLWYFATWLATLIVVVFAAYGLFIPLITFDISGFRACGELSRAGFVICLPFSQPHCGFCRWGVR